MEKDGGIPAETYLTGTKAVPACLGGAAKITGITTAVKITFRLAQRFLIQSLRLHQPRVTFAATTAGGFSSQCVMR